MNMFEIKTKDLKIKLEEKESTISQLQNTINNMKNKILDLGFQVNYCKDKFVDIVGFFKDRINGIFKKETKEKYNSVANELYLNDRIDKKHYNEMLNKNIKNKSDDFEL